MPTWGVGRRLRLAGLGEARDESNKRLVAEVARHLLVVLVERGDETETVGVGALDDLIQRRWHPRTAGRRVAASPAVAHSQVEQDEPDGGPPVVALAHVSERVRHTAGRAAGA